MRRATVTILNSFRTRPLRRITCRERHQCRGGRHSARPYCVLPITDPSHGLPFPAPAAQHEPPSRMQELHDALQCIPLPLVQLPPCGSHECGPREAHVIHDPAQGIARPEDGKRCRYDRPVNGQGVVDDPSVITPAHLVLEKPLGYAIAELVEDPSEDVLDLVHVVRTSPGLHEATEDPMQCYIRLVGADLTQPPWLEQIVAKRVVQQGCCSIEIAHVRAEAGEGER